MYCGNTNSLAISNCPLYIAFSRGFIPFNVIGNFWVISKAPSTLCLTIGKYKGLKRLHIGRTGSSFKFHNWKKPCLLIKPHSCGPSFRNGSLYAWYWFTKEKARRTMYTMVCEWCVKMLWSSGTTRIFCSHKPNAPFSAT